MSRQSTVFASLFLFIATASFAQDKVAPAAALATRHVFTIEAGISAVLPMGASIDGTRRSIPITGGNVAGAELKGEVVPGGADYQVTGNDGNTRLSAVYMIKTDDNVLINVVNEGVIVPPPAGSKESAYFRTAPKFTAPLGKYSWLNNTVFVGTAHVDAARPGIVIIDVYKVL